MPNTPRTSRRAFTLLELILVLVVVATMLALVAPRLSGVTARSRIDSAAATTLAMMHECQQRAINEGTPHRLVLEPDERRAWIETLTPTGYQRPQASYAIDYEWDKALSFEQEGFAEQGGLWSIVFSPDGSAETAELRITQVGQDLRLLSARAATEPYRVTVGEVDEVVAEGGFDVPDY